MRKVILGVVALCVLMFGDTFGAAPALKVPIGHMAVPRDDDWVQLPEDVREELRLLLKTDADGIHALLTSQDPREIGLGLFILEQTGDLKSLTLVVDLLDDHRLTVPYAAPTAGMYQYVPVAQTVGAYLAHIYAMWFRMDSGKAYECMVEIRQLDDPWARPFPWLQKYQRAQRSMLSRDDDVQAHNLRMVAVKQEIAALESEVRWVVVTVGRGRGYYSREEAREMLLALDPVVRDAIMAEDPLVRRQKQIGWELYEKDLAAKAREILKGP